MESTLRLSKTFLAIGVFVLSLSACSGDNDPSSNVTPTPTPTPTPSIAKIDIPTTENIQPVIGAEGGTAMVSFTASDAWTTTSSEEEWLSVSPHTGNAGTATITITIKTNEMYDERVGSITIKSGTASKTITVTQRQLSVLLLTSDKIEVEAKGGEISVEVKANIDVSFKTDVDWITGAETRALDTKKFIFQIKENTSEDMRTGIIEFSNQSEGLSEKVTVVQKATDVFDIYPKSAKIIAKGEVFSVIVRSSMDYHVSSMPEWISETTSRATSTYTHTFKASANEGNSQRSGVIVFCNETGVCIPFHVEQDAPESSTASIDWEKEFVHKSLIMCFTATWCGWCPMMANSIATAKNAIPGSFETVNIHKSSSDLHFDEGDGLVENYKIDSYPMAIVDGRRFLENYDSGYALNLIKSFIDETRNNYLTSSAFALSSSWNGNSLDINLSVFVKTAASYKLTVMLLEDGIVWYQADYVNGSHYDYVHNGIARMAITNVLGDGFETDTNNMRKDFSYKVTVPNDYVKDNVRILVYVQQKFGVQKKLSDGYGDYYVDNCISVKAGESIKPNLK